MDILNRSRRGLLSVKLSLLLQRLEEFLFRIELFCYATGSLQRGHGVIGPVALQVGLSVRRFGRGPWLCYGWSHIYSVRPQLYRLTSGRRRHQEHSDEHESENRAQARDESLVHLNLLLEWCLAQSSVDYVLRKFHALRSCLECKAHRQLHLPCGSEVHQLAHRAIQTAERGARQDRRERLARLNARRSGTRGQTAAKDRRRIGKIRMVKDVVNIPAQSKTFPFFDCEVFGQGHVQLRETLAAQSISRQIAEFARGRYGERGGIQQESRCRVQVGTDSGHKIRTLCAARLPSAGEVYHGNGYDLAAAGYRTRIVGAVLRVQVDNIVARDQHVDRKSAVVVLEA